MSKRGLLLRCFFATLPAVFLAIPWLVTRGSFQAAIVFVIVFAVAITLIQTKLPLE